MDDRVRRALLGDWNRVLRDPVDVLRSESPARLHGHDP
jgi:hypothetical protein